MALRKPVACSCDSPCVSQCVLSCCCKISTIEILCLRRAMSIHAQQLGVLVLSTVSCLQRGKVLRSWFCAVQGSWKNDDVQHFNVLSPIISPSSFCANSPLKAVKLPNLVFFGFVGKLIVCDLRALPTPNWRHRGLKLWRKHNFSLNVSQSFELSRC